MTTTKNPAGLTDAQIAAGTITCTCTVCDGALVAFVTNPLDGLKGKAREQAAHTYVQYALGTSPLAGVMASRYGLVRVA